MKIKIISRDKSKLSVLRKKVVAFPDLFLSNSPDVVICFGGDGTFLHAERLHPGVPKLIIRDGSICKLCHDQDFDFLLEKLFRGEFKVVEKNKIGAFVNGKSLVACNDLVIRNADQHHAIRFDFSFNEKNFSSLIGDGVVICTAFGSTGYFKSITRSSFDEGVGVAFNNLTEPLDPLISINPSISFFLKRNKAYLTADNHSKKIILKQNDEVLIKKSKDVFRIILV